MEIPDAAFLTDQRAVAPIIGFVLLFGIAILAFSGYQATQVPQQNAETEFQHYQDVQDDLIVVRNAISRAGQQGQSQFESVRLGTRYRERIFALNPPDPAGTLRTEGPYEITLANATETKTVKTRFLEYQNGYNELDIEPIYYENSVLYLDTEGGDRVFFEDQNLVRENGNTVVITALQREFSKSATGRVTLELYPTDAGDPLPTGEVDVTLPTRLPESYWSDQVADADPISNFGYNDRPDDINQIEFMVDASKLEFNTIGIDNEPDQTGTVSDINDDDKDLLPGDAVAFDDTNRNSVYDYGENTYTSVKSVKKFDGEAVDLVIARDSIEKGSRDIIANSVTVQDGVTVESENNDLTIESKGGGIVADGATLRAGDDLTLTTNQENEDIDIQNATLSGGGIKASAGEDGIVSVGGARVEKLNGNEGTLEVDSGTDKGTLSYGGIDS